MDSCSYCICCDSCWKKDGMVLKKIDILLNKKLKKYQRRKIISEDLFLEFYGEAFKEIENKKKKLKKQR